MKQSLVASGLVGRRLLRQHIQVGLSGLPSGHGGYIVIIAAAVVNLLHQLVDRQIFRLPPKFRKKLPKFFKLLIHRRADVVGHPVPAFSLKPHPPGSVNSSVPEICRLLLPRCRQPGHLLISHARYGGLHHRRQGNILNGIVNHSQQA